MSGKIFARIKSKGLQNVWLGQNTSERRPGIRMTCKKCGRSQEIPMKHNIAPDIMLEKFARLGWNTSKVRCTDCQKKTPNDTEVHMADAKKIAEGVDSTIMPISLTRKLMATLEDAFNEKEGRYGEDWSDEAVAEETGISVAAVIKTREEAFGTLKMPTELEQFGQDMKAIKQMVSDMEFKFNKLVAQYK